MPIKLNHEKITTTRSDPDPSTWTPEMVSLVTNLRRLQPTALLAIVPQCVTRLNNSDANVGAAIAQLQDQLDYIIVQYYNNPPCSYPYGFNFDDWKTNFKGKIAVGLAGDWTSAIAGGYLNAGELQAVYDMVKNDSQFGGFSVYDVSSSNPPAFDWQ
ncbi:Chitinase 1, partial [Physocladia obscura]